jgi:hypothetical protein
MNTNKPNDDPRFDRLVDGELSESDRRELLSNLDNEPDGWRRCALAFLESQCWKQTLGPLMRESVPRQGIVHEAAKILPRPPRSPWTNLSGTLAAMAASFFIAFWVGAALYHSGGSQGNFDTSAEIAANTSQKPVNLAPLMPVDQIKRTLVQVPPPRVSPMRNVTVSSPSGSSVHVPAVECNNAGREWAQSLPPAMPDDVKQAFARTGHQVDTHRELVPVPMQDGRSLVVPVDQVDIHYVGNKTY